MEKWNSLDVVIPVAKSKNNYLDLKYALRSIEKFVDGVDKVYLIGEKPKWAKNIEHINHSETYLDTIKERNIYEKITHAFEFTDKMFFTNDDIIFTKPTNALEYPYYHKGEILFNPIPLGYKITMNRTRRVLMEKEIPPLNFDVHCPIIYEKEKFAKLKEVDWEQKYGYGIKSLYCGLNGIEGEYMEDCKIVGTFDEHQLEKRHVLSFNDKGLNGLLGYLDKLLPYKSKNEC